MAIARRRGRPSKSPLGAAKMVGVRIAPDLRASLEKAARANERTLSAEIEARLRSTFPAAKRSPR